MNQKGFINIIVIIGVLILVGVAGYFVVSKQALLPVPVPSPTPTPTPGMPIPGPITVNGEITCLPKKGTGQQTLKCAIGLKGSDGRHYGLKNLSEHDPEYRFSVGGLSVEVTGAFSQEEVSGPDGNKYDVVGIIDVTSIKEIKKKSEGCVISGCGGEICAEEVITTTCIFRPESACYSTARCERSNNNQCGWVMTEELKSCLTKVRSR